jgi:predicted HAD superfamily Cof-like phosphohydrolase
MIIIEKDIREFHEKFEINYDGPPRTLDLDLADFRIKFMMEEIKEYVLAHENNDMEGMLDALVDLIYVAAGTAHLHGFPLSTAWTRVHYANMQKIRGSRETSKRNSPYDVVKPEGWQPPNLKDLVNA